jgi:hypothetical protein
MHYTLWGLYSVYYTLWGVHYALWELWEPCGSQKAPWRPERQHYPRILAEPSRWHRVHRRNNKLVRARPTAGPTAGAYCRSLQQEPTAGAYSRTAYSRTAYSSPQQQACQQSAAMAPKGGINVRVLTMDTELEFTIQARHM